MRIGIDAREVEKEFATGIGRSLKNFLHYLADTPGHDRMLLFSSRPLSIRLGPKMDNYAMFEDSTKFWEQVKLPLVMRGHMLEIFYSPYFTVPLLSPVLCVCSVLDVTYLRFAPYRRWVWPWRWFRYQVYGKMCVAKAKKVVTCSQFSKEEILKVYGLKRTKVAIVPLSVSPAFQPEPDAGKIEAVKAKLGIRGRYLLYVGDFREHKNISGLLHAFRSVLGSEDLKLVLVGPKRAGFRKVAQLIKTLELSERVVITGQISDDQVLRTLYAGAEVFVLPSLYEGFGLPAVEAMACGTPVVASNAGALPEVLGDAAVMVDATKPEEIARAIVTVMRDPVLKRGLIRQGALRAAQLNEHTVSRKLLDVLKDSGFELSVPV